MLAKIRLRMIIVISFFSDRINALISHDQFHFSFDRFSLDIITFI